jgi:hypothetical protein
MITTCSRDRDATRRAFARRLKIHHRLLTGRASTNEPAYEGLSLATVCPTFTCCGRTRLLSDVTAFRYLHQRLLSSYLLCDHFRSTYSSQIEWSRSPSTLTTTGCHANQRRYSDRLCSRNVSMCCRVAHRMQVDLFFGPRITKYIQYLADSNEKD